MEVKRESGRISEVKGEAKVAISENGEVINLPHQTGLQASFYAL